MQHILKTIKIEHEKSKSGFCVINESDYNESKHTLFKEKAQTQTKAKAKKIASK
jgi:hypothetical protein